ncbi:hypothetical protein MBLNU230_g7059t1 [Neophaeotheca triangularis]
MRFRAQVTNINTFTKLIASLATLNNIAWVRLDDNDVRFTVLPDKGSQVWSVLAIETIFETYNIQSAAPGNTINLQFALPSLLIALRSAQNAVSAEIRLTKKEGKPLLSLTIYAEASSHAVATASRNGAFNDSDGANPNSFATGPHQFREESADLFGPTRNQNREVVITQDVPVKVLAPASVANYHEPHSRDPDAYINLPNLLQLKSISDRFTKIALSKTSGDSARGRTGFASASSGPRLELSANMHGCLRLSLNTDAMRIKSQWTGLVNPELDPSQHEDGSQGLANHPSARMKELGDSRGESEEGWASVKVDGKDWGKVLSVGRLNPSRVIACFVDGTALVLYVFLGEEDSGATESVLTYHITSYS